MKEFIVDMMVLGFWRTIYGTFFYRMHMRWLHKRGRHYYSYSRPNGDYMRWCHWCGDRNVVKAYCEPVRNDLVDAVAYMMQGYKPPKKGQ